METSTCQGRAERRAMWLGRAGTGGRTESLLLLVWSLGCEWPLSSCAQHSLPNQWEVSRFPPLSYVSGIFLGPCGALLTLEFVFPLCHGSCTLLQIPVSRQDASCSWVPFLLSLSAQLCLLRQSWSYLLSWGAPVCLYEFVWVVWVCMRHTGEMSLPGTFLIMKVSTQNPCQSTCMQHFTRYLNYFFPIISK